MKFRMTWLAAAAALAVFASASMALASGGGTSGGGTGTKVDAIKVSKAYTNADIGGYEMLIKASSSDTTARLFAYRPDGVLIGEVQNGGGSRYGGTVMPAQMIYSPTITIASSSGGSTTVPTTPFQP